MTKVLAVAGWPHTGKTTLANGVEAKPGQRVEVLHTDDLIPLGWSESSLAACEALEKVIADDNAADVFVIEGVAVPRVLRKFIERNPDARPCAELSVLRTVYGEPLTKGQRSMAKGHDTVLGKIMADLVRLEVFVVDPPQHSEDPGKIKSGEVV